MAIFSFSAQSAPKNRNSNIKRGASSVTCSEFATIKRAEGLVLYLLAINQDTDRGQKLSTNIKRLTPDENTDYYRAIVSPGGDFVGTYEIIIQNSNGCEVTSVKRLGAG